MSSLKQSPGDRYFWRVGDAWHIGTAQRVKPFDCIEMRTLEYSESSPPPWHVLMRHQHTGELEWVPESKLQPYYGDNQPEGK